MVINRRSFLITLGASFLLSGTQLFAQSRNLEASVVAMVDAAANAIHSHGLKDALNNTPRDMWVRERSGLYVFIFDGDGFLLLHPDEQMIGVNIRGSRDVQGNTFIRNILKALTKPGTTFWSEYLWFDPVDARTRRKRVYSRKVGDLIVSCGYYLDQA